MLAHHYPGLFDDDPAMKARAENLAGRCHELMSFLVDVLGVTKVAARYDGAVDLSRFLLGPARARRQAAAAPPARLGRRASRCSEMKTPEVCCGFGGTFCVKYPEISNAMVGEKTGDIAATGADTLLAGDLGCLMNMAGKLQREGRAVKVRHVAEVLADMGDDAPIGERNSADAIDRARLQAQCPRRAAPTPTCRIRSAS